MLHPTSVLLALLFLCPAVYAHDVESIGRLWHKSVRENGEREAIRQVQTRILLHIAANDGVEAVKKILSASKESTSKTTQFIAQTGGIDPTPFSNPSTSRTFQKGADFHFEILDLVVEFMEKRARSK